MIECTCVRNENLESLNEEDFKEINDGFPQWDKEKAIQKVFMICIVLFFVIVPFLMSPINKDLWIAREACSFHSLDFHPDYHKNKTFNFLKDKMMERYFHASFCFGMDLSNRKAFIEGRNTCRFLSVKILGQDRTPKMHQIRHQNIE